MVGEHHHIDHPIPKKEKSRFHIFLDSWSLWAFYDILGPLGAIFDHILSYGTAFDIFGNFDVFLDLLGWGGLYMMMVSYLYGREGGVAIMASISNMDRSI